jgi:hypothetical protein
MIHKYLSGEIAKIPDGSDAGKCGTCKGEMYNCSEYKKQFGVEA